MKVHELINELLTLDQNAEVLIEAAVEPVPDYEPARVWVEGVDGRVVVILGRE